MPRARNLKPATFKNELLGTGDPLLMTLFMGLWCLADREGKLEDRPLRIKAEIFPYREGLDINGLLTELERLEFICRYSANGTDIVQVTTFNKHQNPHRTEKASVLPDNPIKTTGCDLTVKDTLKNEDKTEVARLTPDSLVLTPDSGLLTADVLAENDPHHFPEITEAVEYLKWYSAVTEISELHIRRDPKYMRQAKSWLEDGVTRDELSNAIQASYDRLKSKGDESAPPLMYVAKVLASHRVEGTVVSAGQGVESNDERAERLAGPEAMAGAVNEN